MQARHCTRERCGLVSVRCSQVDPLSVHATPRGSSANRPGRTYETKQHAWFQSSTSPQTAAYLVQIRQIPDGSQRSHRQPRPPQHIPRLTPTEEPAGRQLPELGGVPLKVCSPHCDRHLALKQPPRSRPTHPLTGISSKVDRGHWVATFGKIFRSLFDRRISRLPHRIFLATTTTPPSCHNRPQNLTSTLPVKTCAQAPVNAAAKPVPVVDPCPVPRWRDSTSGFPGTRMRMNRTWSTTRA